MIEARAAATAVTVVAPRHGEGFVLDARPQPRRRLLTDLWRRRALLLMLARKDFFVRYRRSWMGLLWVVLVPLAQAAVLALVFSRLGRFSAGTPHYPVYVFSGFMAWSFFSGSVVAGATAVVDGKDLAAKIYFPRVMLPMVKLLTDSFTLLTSVGILLILCGVFGVHIGVEFLLIVPALALLLALALGFTMVLSAVHVYFRDVRFIVATVILPWFYLTPVFYSPQQLEGRLSEIVPWNPACGVVDMVRAATVGAGPSWRTSVPVSVVWAAVLLLVGLELQRRLDRTMTDLL